VGYIVRTSWGEPKAPRDFPAATARDVYELLSALGRDEVHLYEIIGPDGHPIDEQRLFRDWRAEQDDTVRR
jgi:hypothetical protein